MMGMLQLKLDPAAEKAFKESKTDKAVRWIRLQIQDEKISETGRGAATEDVEKDIDGGLRGSVKEEDVPFYAVVRATGDCDWVVFAYIPDAAKVKERMKYASTLENLKAQLGDSILGEVRGADKDEIEWARIKALVSKKKGDTDFTDAMTESEKQRAEDDAIVRKEIAERKADTSYGGVSSGIHNVTFPIGASAVEAMKKIGAGDAKAVVIKNENGKLELAETFADAGSIDDVTKTLETESRFIIWNVGKQVKKAEKKDDDSSEEEEEKKEENGSACDHLFIYYASDSCPVKKRMHYASSCGACYEHADANGCHFLKRLEFSEKEEITSKEIENALKPADDDDDAGEAPSKPKPKIPGQQGQRMLIG
eukprot:TRINITY_DN4296_c0_g3_i1.p2 TRINITY_DN4296_c0_g3~~TRINITY_DN4296_c0_g3_i1.p2  ORF type:complete len:367 (+),score=197.53 TRINITY_DN4296_c0_g3_i1:64-1164(+)